MFPLVGNASHLNGDEHCNLDAVIVGEAADAPLRQNAVDDARGLTLHRAEAFFQRQDAVADLRLIEIAFPAMIHAEPVASQEMDAAINGGPESIRQETPDDRLDGARGNPRNPWARRAFFKLTTTGRGLLPQDAIDRPRPSP